MTDNPLNYDASKSPFGAKPEFEDGTNIAFGTPFREEFTRKVFPWYVPEKAKGARSWKENCDRLRARFDKFIDEHCTSESFLIQTLMPQMGQVPTGPPGLLPDRQLLLAGAGLGREAAALYGIQGPIAAQFPIMNVRGEPFVGPDGKATPFKLGLNRYNSTYAIPDGLRPLPIPKLTELLGDGTNLLYQLPSDIAVRIWRNWLTGFSQKESYCLWIDALFELAWQRAKGSPFHCERYAWFGNGSVGLSGKGLFPRLPQFITTTPGAFCTHEHGYPRAFYSKIPDIARASIAAIDEILDLAEIPSIALAILSKSLNINQYMKKKTPAHVFISHSSQDKPFVYRLVSELKKLDLNVWLDDLEIKVGDSIVSKISDGLKNADYLVVVLSKASVASPWVRRELDSALMNEISGKGATVLPALIEDCDIPPLLRDRLYADFRQNFTAGFEKISSVLKQENESAADLGTTTTTTTTTTALPKTTPCTTTLAALSLGELRRRITKRMSRSEVSIIWFDIFELKMDDDMMHWPLGDCVIELLDRANKRFKLGKVIDAICSERNDLATP
jgi:hypothetical protein